MQNISTEIVKAFRYFSKQIWLYLKIQIWYMERYETTIFLLKCNCWIFQRNLMSNSPANHEEKKNKFMRIYFSIQCSSVHCFICIECVTFNLYWRKLTEITAKIYYNTCLKKAWCKFVRTVYMTFGENLFSVEYHTISYINTSKRCCCFYFSWNLHLDSRFW